MSTHIVLFGVTGDLSRSKLIPSLTRLWLKDASLSFIGFGRKAFSNEEFENFIFSYSKNTDFAKRWIYIQSELDDDAGYKLVSTLVRKSRGVVFYIALPPSHQKEVASRIIKNDSSSRGVFPKHHVIAFEKPYGHSSASAKALDAYLLKKVRPSQILRVDHYAGKQALIDIEKGAKMHALGDSFNAEHVSKVAVHFKEMHSAEGRGAFYDGVGAMADVLQNHMLFMLSTVLSVPYILNSKKKITKEKLLSPSDISSIRENVLKNISIKDKNTIKLGQYKGFKNETGVSPQSTTETSFEITGTMSPKDVYWKGVDVVLLGGKALKENDSAIYIYYKNGETLRLPVNRYGTKDAKDAYDEVFESALLESQGQKTGRFISLEQILLGWKLVEKIKKMGIKPEIY